MATAVSVQFEKSLIQAELDNYPGASVEMVRKGNTVILVFY